VSVNFAYVEKRSLQPAFIERKMTVREPRPLPSIVVPELPSAVIPQPKAIQAPTTEAMSLEPTQPEPRRSAFKNKEGTAREWKPID
jgi:hypothetical protein